MAHGRYAPSPTGHFHLGNLRTAVAASLFAATAGSELRLRWEDLDTTADVAFEREQQRDLDRLGIRFHGSPVRQTQRLDAYREAIRQLEVDGLVYACWCSRREIREATRAPHGVPGAYPGTCRALSRAEVRAREATGRPPAKRLRADDTPVTVVDRLHGRHTAEVDDFVLARGDGTPAYHLVMVVDDAFQGVEEVVRGDDLLPSTPRHAHLQHLLGLPTPVWAHVPVVVDGLGTRLAKRDGSIGLDGWLTAGGTVESLLGAIGRTLGVDVDGPTTVAELCADFEPDAIPLASPVLRVETMELSLPR